MYIKISVNNKIATVQDNVLIINGNSDYVIKFDFDAEWDAYETKTARFVTARGYTDVVFSGDEVALPVITDAISVRVGVFAGNLHTTTPAVIFCRRCITDGSGSPVEPTPDVYAQIMERLNNLDGATPATAEKLGVVKIGDNLKITETGVLSVDTADAAAQDNTRPITSAAVYTAKSNIEALLGDLADLTTEAKNNLVAAINEAAQSGGGGGSSIALDTTLTQSGKAADAKAVGDALAGKQNTISDLETIRSGAAKGATALQSVPSTYRTAAAQDVIDSGKVDKVTGKGLSSNDYTDAAKAKVDALALVATSGSYNDLADKPTIPTALPNPNALTFTGAVTGSYDGSAPMTVNIPEGGGGTGGGYSDYEVLIDETITTDEAGISAISYTELDFSQYNDIVIFFDRAMNKANSSKDLKVIIKMLGYSTASNHSIANPVDSYRSSIFRVLNMGNGNVASFSCTANNQNNNPAQLYCCGIFPFNGSYKAASDNGFNLEFNGTYIGTIKLKILAK